MAVRVNLMCSTLGSPEWESVGPIGRRSPSFLRKASPGRFLAPAAALWAVCWGLDKPHSFPPTPPPIPSLSPHFLLTSWRKGPGTGAGGEPLDPCFPWWLAALFTLPLSRIWSLQVVPGDRKDMGLGIKDSSFLKFRIILKSSRV